MKMFAALHADELTSMLSFLPAMKLPSQLETAMEQIQVAIEELKNDVESFKKSNDEEKEVEIK